MSFLRHPAAVSPVRPIPVAQGCALRELRQEADARVTLSTAKAAGPHACPFRFAQGDSSSTAAFRPVPPLPTVTPGPPLPPHQRAAPQETGTERRHRDQITRPNPASSYALVQGAGDRRRGGVSIPHDVVLHHFGPERQNLLHHLRNAKVGLKGDQAPEIRGGVAGN